MSQGLSVQAYVERPAHQAAQSETPPHAPKRTPAEAIAHIRESHKGVTLGGLKIKDLVHESQK